MSGVAIVNQLLFVFNLTIFGGLAGASIFGAQFYGKGDHKGVRYALRFKLIFSVLMAVIAIVALLFFNNPLISLFLTESESGGDLVLTLSEAKNYLFVMLIGLIPFSFSQSYSSTLRETGETVSPMTASIIAIVTNFVLNYILIFGSFGAPRLRRRRRSHRQPLSQDISKQSISSYIPTAAKRHLFLHRAYIKACICPVPS